MITEISIIDLLLSKVKDSNCKVVDVKFQDIRYAKQKIEAKNSGVYIDCSYRSVYSIANKYPTIFSVGDTSIKINNDEVSKEKLVPDFELNL